MNTSPRKSRHNTRPPSGSIIRAAAAVLVLMLTFAFINTLAADLKPGVAFNQSAFQPGGIVDALKHRLGLDLKSPPRVRVLPSGEFTALLARTIHKEDRHAEEILIEGRLLKLLGVIPKSFEYLKTLDKDLGEVTGFYDQGTIFLNAGEPPQDKWETYSHELCHKAQDDTHVLARVRKLHDAPVPSPNSDRIMALSALLEGHCTWFEHLPSECGTIEGTDRCENQIAELKTRFDSVKDEVNHTEHVSFMTLGGLFPYFEGLKFIQNLARRSPTCVQEAYQYPPVSTEQILHPALYPYDVPYRINTSDAFLGKLLGDGWEGVYEDVWGEWFMAHWFEKVLSKASARYTDPAGQVAAAGWDGDRIFAFEDERGELAIVHLAVWDTIGDADQYTNAMADVMSVHHPGAIPAGSKLVELSGSQWTVSSFTRCAIVRSEETRSVFIDTPVLKDAEGHPYCDPVRLILTAEKALKHLKVSAIAMPGPTKLDGCLSSNSNNIAHEITIKTITDDRYGTTQDDNHDTLEEGGEDDHGQDNLH